MVCCISDGVYTDNYPESEWGYLQRGFAVNFPMYGLIHYDVAEADLKLISRLSAGN